MLAQGGLRNPDGHRWERLFADLEASAAEDDRAELAAEVADRTRGELGRVRLADRLRAAIGHEVRLALVGGQSAAGTVREVGPDWLLLAETPARVALVPLAAVVAVRGLGAHSAAAGSEGRVGAKLGLRYALRRLARDRVPLSMLLVGGTVLAGTCDRVGADFLELAEHPPGEPRRANAVREVSAVPFTALVLARSV